MLYTSACKWAIIVIVWADKGTLRLLLYSNQAQIVPHGLLNGGHLHVLQLMYLLADFWMFN